MNGDGSIGLKSWRVGRRALLVGVSAIALMHARKRYTDGGSTSLMAAFAEETPPDQGASKQTTRDSVSIEKNKALVIETWQAFWRGDIDAGIDNLADDATWYVPGTNSMSGLKTGKENIRKFRFSGRSVFAELRRDIVGLYGDGDIVVMEAHAEGTLKNGAPYTNDGCVVWELKDGKVIHVREYVDTLKAVAIDALAEND